MVAFMQRLEAEPMPASLEEQTTARALKEGCEQFRQRCRRRPRVVPKADRYLRQTSGICRKSRMTTMMAMST